MGVRMNDDREVGGGGGPAGPAQDPAPAARRDAGTEPGTDAETAPEPGAEAGDGDSADSGDSGDGDAREPAPPPSAVRRPPPSLTTHTARPEGGGRAAPGDAPAPARQWPLLTVLALVGTGLLIVGLNPFDEAFRIGTLLVGAGLLTGAALRRVLPSVGMLAVRSRFTDLLTYGLLGVVITLLAMLAQPDPWLDLPFLEDLVRFTFRE
ncbi:hypothetical protein GCM10010387_09840 [Streptomyces inusitatus]|uniref:Integral membrane protein n=1 Tax=Streptomyces inusitatus TaxID=68221 RepID=A0A918ULT0_9ACTN|nr:DUF3017 domain-containing protein [Streptomyces inusitatus]GGZ19179.1 hypothetical protein GCM10010387_09840 [Streptomyces inusitatus]